MPAMVAPPYGSKQPYRAKAEARIGTERIGEGLTAPPAP